MKKFNFYVWLMILIVFAVLGTGFLHAQDNQIANKELKKQKAVVSEITAKIKNVIEAKDKLKIEVEIENPSNQFFFVAVNPTGHDGSILSALNFDKESKSLEIVSRLDEHEQFCTTPFGKGGVNLLKISPKSSVSIYYYLPFPQLKIYPLCNLPYKIDSSTINSVSVSLGFFMDDNGIDSLSKEKTRFTEFDLIDDGENSGKRLFEFQKTKELSYKIR
jgi:hypothetical protein